MSFFNRMLRRLARPEDQVRLDEHPRGMTRLRVVARVAMRFWWAYLVLLVLAGTVVVASGMDVYHRTEMPQFCGACHEMQPNFESWSVSRHRGVRCVDCHAKPGLSGWMEAKMNGVRQLMYHFSADNIDDIHMGEEHLTIVSDNCQRCHPGAVRVDDRGGLAISHQHHQDIGAQCVVCHSRRFAHPDSEAAAIAVGLADRSQCYSCHDGDHRIGDKTAFNAMDDKNCARCHEDAQVATEHGGGTACLDCHEASNKGHYLMDPDNQAALCARCHDVPERMASEHPPAAKGNCRACHRVMSPPHLYGTGPRPDSSLCLSCHEDFARLLDDDSQTVSAFADGKVDLHRAHEEYVAGDSEAWCLGCHSPHGSAAPRALIAIRRLDGDKARGSYTAHGRGGACTGACHDSDEMEYAGKQAEGL